jgi:TolB-like protein
LLVEDGGEDEGTEEIIHVLAHIPGLKVIARTSAFAFKGKNEDVRRIAETLRVAHILEGGVRRAGNRIRVTAQLIAAADGSHLWSERYDREMADVFEIQGRFRESVTEMRRAVEQDPLNVSWRSILGSH